MADADSYYRSRFTFDSRRDAVWKEIAGFLQKRYIPIHSSILEIGAGYCHFINHVAGREKHALDISDEVLRYAGRGVIPHVQSCTDMQDIEDAHFDVIFASNVFEHLARDETARALAESRRVLNKNGKLIVLQPNFKYCCREYFDDYTHVQVFTDVGLADLLVASGFTILDIKPRFLPFSMKAHLPTNPWLVRLYLQSPFKPFAGQMLIVAVNGGKKSHVG
jgi:SAM-dependent methyltransferase